jgi:amidase
LPPPRHEKLADFRVLVIDTHPLCPTADSIKSALNGLADRLAKLDCRVLRESPKLPDLARTTRTYVELLAAVYSLDLKGGASQYATVSVSFSLGSRRLHQQSIF